MNINSDQLSSKPKGRLSEEGVGLWTDNEHARFIEAMQLYPKGPWKLVAKYVGTRNARQTMTHAQKYRQKLERHERGLRTKRKDVSSESPRCYSHKRIMKPIETNIGFCLAPYGYESPKDVASEPLPATLAQGMWQDMLQSVPVRDQSWTVHSHSMLPLSDLEAHISQPVESTPVWIDDCLNYFIDTFT